MNEQWFLLGDIHGSAQPVHYFYQENKGLGAARNSFIKKTKRD